MRVLFEGAHPCPLLVMPLCVTSVPAIAYLPTYIEIRKRDIEPKLCACHRYKKEIPELLYHSMYM